MSPEPTSVSPELALVDPELAESARRRLPMPPDTVEAVRVHRTEPSSTPAASAQRLHRWRSRFVTWAAMLALLAGAGFLVGSRADGDVPEESHPAPIVKPQPRPVAPPTDAPSRSRAAAIATRRFAWAPVSGATGYHVELFKGSALVFRDRTTKPHIVIRRTWRLNGRRRTLQPGTYRWYVWPLVAGHRKNAIVQSSLVVPG